MKRTLALLAAALLLWPAFGADYGDTVYERKAKVGDDVPPAVFPHKTHRMAYKCSACHEEHFKMKAGANEVSMELIREQKKSCGACHDGKTAFEANFDTCQRCHYK